jgi:hypothetical protein
MTTYFDQRAFTTTIPVNFLRAEYRLLSIPIGRARKNRIQVQPNSKEGMSKTARVNRARGRES